jgi:cell division protease FtsH
VFVRKVRYPANDTRATPTTLFKTQVPVFWDHATLTKVLQSKGVQVDASAPAGPSLLAELLLGFGSTLLFVGLFWFLSRRAGGMGALGGFGRSKARRVDPTSIRVTFDDVADIEDVKAELTEIVDFLRSPQRYERLGGRMPHGVRLFGPPGTGKTLLARAVAGEAPNAAFFSIAASEFIEAIVGVGAARVRDLFAKAKEAAPAIIFIDELDAIGRSRQGSTAFGGGNDEREQTLDQILAVHTRKVPLADDVDLGSVAASTPGMVGADLANLANEAALLAARRDHDKVQMADIIESLAKIMLGAPRGIILTAPDGERIAYHESGHALVGMLTPDADPVRAVSVIPREQALGVTLSTPDADRLNYTREELEAKIKVALGGRVAEEVVYGQITTGAESDIQQLTQIARQMVGRWGMSDKLGPMAVLSQRKRRLVTAGSQRDIPSDPLADRRGSSALDRSRS